MVLEVPGLHVADTRDAECEHVRSRLNRIPHEVAVQSALAGGDGQLVVGKGKVIHTNGLISRVQEPLHGSEVQLEFQIGSRQLIPIDLSLVAFEPRHIRE